MQLLDVNMLIALCDSRHIHRPLAKEWFRRQSQDGWATCPLTENGLIRILGQKAYPNGPQTPTGARSILKQLTSLPGHQFWHDNISLSDADLFGELTGVKSKQLTDLYLLGLAASRGGTLVTIDSGIDAGKVTGGERALIILAA
jgi:uncharacterized protein